MKNQHCIGIDTTKLFYILVTVSHYLQQRFNFLWQSKAIFIDKIYKLLLSVASFLVFVKRYWM